LRSPSGPEPRIDRLYLASYWTKMLPVVYNVIGGQIMTETSLSLASSESICRAIADLATADKVRASKIQPAGSIAEGLNAPITSDDIIAAMHVIQAMFTGGTAAVAFLVQVRDFLKPGDAVVLTRKGRKRQHVLKSDTPRADIENYFGGDDTDQ
jgi:hypothetical protein